ncbi:MAG: Npt1/Npt2 family nucleotide transporter [Elusimicrobiaceae bacterium]|nr:Npt1/Npt2 family nucleotide transporter [Elusimicrobiaceae bacterium]
MTNRSDRKVLYAALCVAVSSAFLVGGYEFARNSATTLFMQTLGTENMPYALAVVPVVMFGMIYLFGKVLSRTGPLRAMLLSMAVTAAVMTGAYFGVRNGSPTAAALYYIFAQAYIVVLVEQFWSFINSTLDSTQAKLYNGIVAGIGALGPIAAAYFIHSYVTRIGTEQLLLWSAATLLPSALMIILAYRYAGEPEPTEEESGGKAGTLHLSLILETKPLLILMGIIFLTQVLSTVLELKFNHILEMTIIEKNARSAFLGGFWMKVNMLSFVLQFVATPILLRKLSARAVMVAIPVIHLTLAAGLLVSPTLAVASAAFIVFKGLDYSLFRAGKELFYIPLSFDARYRAKQIVDAFTYRFSKGITATALSIWKTIAGSVPPVAYPVIALAAAGLWIRLAVPLTEKYDGNAKK